MKRGKWTPETTSPAAWLPAGVAADEPLAGTAAVLAFAAPDAPLTGCGVGAGGGGAVGWHAASSEPAIPRPVTANSARRVSSAGSDTWRKLFAIRPQRLELWRA